MKVKRFMQTLKVKLTIVLLFMVTLSCMASFANRHRGGQNDIPKEGGSGTVSGWLHTQGTQILDSNNNPVVFHGVNTSGTEWGAGHPWTREGCPDKRLGCWTRVAADEFQNIAAWGFNTVRIPVSWSNLEPSPPGGSGTHQYNELYLRDLDNIVDQCSQQHIMVIFSMHQWGWSPGLTIAKHGGKVVHGNGLPAWLYQEGTSQDDARRSFFDNEGNVQEGVSSAWKFLAQRYNNNPTVVGADMFNEPELKAGNANRADHFNGPTPLDMLYRRIGQAIRSVNPHILLMFQDSNSTPVSTAPPFDNVVYSFHSYPSQSRGYEAECNSWIREHMNRAAHWNVPVWLGEFQILGRNDQPDGPDGFVAQTEPLMRFLKNNGISWTYWAYQKATHPLGGESGRGPINQPLVDFLKAWI